MHVSIRRANAAINMRLRQALPVEAGIRGGGREHWQQDQQSACFFSVACAGLEVAPCTKLSKCADTAPLPLRVKSTKQVRTDRSHRNLRPSGINSPTFQGNLLLQSSE